MAEGCEEPGGLRPAFFCRYNLEVDVNRQNRSPKRRF